jgi:malonyl-CoA O-methyltransferase
VNQRKIRIRKKFSKAAGTYDQYAVVQERMACSLVDKLTRNQEKRKKILEIGCGSGNYTRLLQKRFPDSRITVIDFSESMIEHAGQKIKESSNINFICTDAEKYLENSLEYFELITSNATFQWFEDFGKAGAGVARILEPRGQFIGTVFGPETLFELGAGISTQLDSEFILPSARFPTMQMLKDSLGKVFSKVHIEEFKEITVYRSFKELLGHLSKTGVGGGQRKKPFVFTRNKLARLDSWFEQNYGRCQGTYHYFLVNCSK